MLAELRKLRHGQLKKLEPLWRMGGSILRVAIKKTAYKNPVKQFIGPYGPFLMHPNFMFSNFENWGQGHNSGFVAFVEACRDKSCVIDVGAHIGLVSLPASQAIKSGGSVYAFEPAQINREYLNFHIRNNNIDNIFVSDCLVGNEEKESVTFFEDTKDNGMNSLLMLKDKGNFVTTQRHQITLDSFCDKNNIAPDLVKIDVEGAEIMVLKGAAKTLKGYKPLIFLSIHPSHIEKLGSKLSDLLELIKDMGYEIKNPDGTLATDIRLDEYVLEPKKLEQSSKELN